MFMYPFLSQLATCCQPPVPGAQAQLETAVWWYVGWGRAGSQDTTQWFVAAGYCPRVRNSHLVLVQVLPTAARHGLPHVHRAHGRPCQYKLPVRAEGRSRPILSNSERLVREGRNRLEVEPCQRSELGMRSGRGRGRIGVGREVGVTGLGRSQ